MAAEPLTTAVDDEIREKCGWDYTERAPQEGQVRHSPRTATIVEFSIVFIVSWEFSTLSVRINR